MKLDDDMSILSSVEVAKALGISRRTLDRLEEAGELPGKIQLSARRVGWRKSTIHAWLTSREINPAQ